MASVKITEPKGTTGTGNVPAPSTDRRVDAAGGPLSPRDLAAERLADYFRSVGLRDDRFLQEAVSGVMQATDENRSGPKTEDYVRDVMEAAIRDFQQWLDHLVSATRDQTGGRVARGCVAWRLRRLLGDHPEAFLKQEGLPDGFREALLDAAVPVLPEPNPFPMAPQNIGRSWSFGFRSFWGRILGHGHSTSGARDRGRTGGES